MATDTSGEFIFEEIPEGDYLLIASFVGYEIHERELTLSGDMEVAPVVVDEVVNDLDEVAITIKNPTVTREVDRLVFRVEKTSLSSGTTWYIIKTTPML